LAKSLTGMQNRCIRQGGHTLACRLNSTVASNQYGRLIEELQLFREEHGHPLVPTRGIELGKRLAALRKRWLNNKLPKSAVDYLLDRMPDFPFQYHEWRWQWRVVDLLRTYKEVNGHLVVPHLFVVPAEEPWPKETCGIKLGQTVRNIRARKNYYIKGRPDRLKQLEDLGFVWSEWGRRWDLTLESLRTFKHVHGHIRVPVAFVVPHGTDSPWAESCWGISLGISVQEIRRNRCVCS
jgi:hypothetical protein